MNKLDLLGSKSMITTLVSSNGVLVASIQVNPVILEVESNLAKAVQLVFEAAQKGARVIVLPELAISGCVFRNVSEASSCAQARDGYQTQAISKICQQFGCHVIFGYVEIFNGLLYNSAVVVGPNGKVQANIQKHNLYGSDNLWAQPSEAIHPIVITEAGRLGVLICRDASNNNRESYQFYDSTHKFYHKGSIDTLALITNWAESYAYPDAAWVDLSEKLRANVIVSNRVGKERDMSFKGGSCIIDRDRKIWTNGNSFTEPTIVGGFLKI